MAEDKKISGLPLATTPLAGTEEQEIIQGGVNKRVAVSNVGGSGAAASETTPGIAEIATQAETNTGTDDARIVTPLKLKNLDSDAVALVDAATIDITGPKHTLATATSRAFTKSFTGDCSMIEITLSATSANMTFPVGYLCKSDGLASGDNILALAGVSGDKYVIGVIKIGSANHVFSQNNGQ